MKKFSCLFLALIIGCSSVNKPVTKPIPALDILRDSSIDNIQDGTVKIINYPVMGSGLVIAQKGEYAYIITALHILTGRDKLPIPKNVVVFFNDRDGAFVKEGADAYIGDIVSMSSKEMDLALIKVKIYAKVVIFLSSNLPSLGSDVSICGFPYSVAMFVTYGKITRYDKNDGYRYLFTSAGVVSGNSGGGIFYNGRCIGIVQATLFSMDKYHFPVGYNYGISSLDVIKYIKSVDKTLL